MIFSNDVLQSIVMDGIADVTLLEMEFIFQLNKDERRIKYKHRRINWEEHMDMLRHTRQFQSRYHMKESSFNTLINLLRDDIKVNEVRSRASSMGNEPIFPELVAAAGLRFLGGEFPKSLADIYGMSVASTDRVIRLFLKAVIMCDSLSLQIPVTKDELKKGAGDFTNISGAFGLYHGVIGAIDGWLCTTQQPGDVPNPADHFSGHYQRFGLNVQAICDANLRFLYVAIAAPGKTNDSRAFSRLLELRKWLNELPEEYFLIGDGAYAISNKMLIPYAGAEKHTPYKRTYNFYLSQMRIRIEMAFGRLTTKWRIFRRDLSYSTRMNSNIIQAAFRLHNFVIDNENISFQKLSVGNTLEQWGVDPLLHGPNGNNGYLNIRTPRPVATTPDISRRVAILDNLKVRDMRRPSHNIERNNDDLNYESDQTTN